MKTDPKRIQPNRSGGSRCSVLAIVFTLIGAVLGLCALAFGVTLVAINYQTFDWSWLPQFSQVGTPGNEHEPVIQTPEPMLVVETLAAAPGGSVQDAYGAVLTLPAGVMEDDGSAEMVVFRPGGELLTDLKNEFTIESPVYAVQTNGQQDPAGKAELVVPALSQDSRLAVLIDGQYLGILDVRPQDGQLSLPVFISAPETESDYPGLQSSDQPVQYLVLTPRQTESGSPAVQPAAKRFAISRQEAYGKDCSTTTLIYSKCWRTRSASIYIYWDHSNASANLGLDVYDHMDNTLKAVENIMGFYSNELKLDAANISSKNVLQIVVSAKTQAPYYSPRSGVIYLPWDVVAAPEGSRELAHELFHWVQDEEYRMLIAYYSHSASWWLEMSAEVATFLIKPENLDVNLTQYGRVTTSNNLLGFSDSPFLWEGNSEEARYIQAQQLFLGLCDGPDCVISQERWAEANNIGAYPLDSSAQQRYEALAAPFGRYLLGEMPGTGRGHTPSAATLTGAQFGDYIHISQKAEMDYGLTNENFKRDGAQLLVQAPLKKGGVYPLYIGSGRSGALTRSNPGLPALVTVKAGAPFIVRLGDQPAKYYDGASEVRLGVVSDKLGFPMIRIVAVAPTQDVVFNAVLETVNLSGDWQLNLHNLQADTGGCPDSDASQFTSLPADAYGMLFSGYGAYQMGDSGVTGRKITWAPEPMPDELAELELSSEGDMTPEGIKLNYLIHIPYQDSSSGTSKHVPGSAIFMGLAGLPFLGMALRPSARLKRNLRLAFLLIGAALLLSGCFGLNIYGDISGNYEFKKLEWIDPQDNPYGDARYQWRLSDGKMTLDFDLTIEATTEDEEGNESVGTSHCFIRLTADAEAFVGEDGLVPPPDFSGGDGN